MVHAYHDKVIILILQGKFGGQLLTALLAKVSQTFLFWQKIGGHTGTRSQRKTSEVTKTRASSNCN